MSQVKQQKRQRSYSASAGPKGGAHLAQGMLKPLRFGWVRRFIQSNKQQHKGTRNQQQENLPHIMFESTNDNVLTRPMVSRGNLKRLAPRASSSSETLNTVGLSTLELGGQVHSQSNSLYVNNPRNGYALDDYSLNDTQSMTDINTSTKSGVFDGAANDTPETSIASGVTHGTHLASNYTYSNPVAHGGAQYSRSVATSAANNDSSSVITIASSTRNILNRSKSSRRSVETFNSSTIGIPPSSIFERLHTVVAGPAAAVVGNDEESNDILSLNNSLRTYYSTGYPRGDNNSCTSYKTKMSNS